MTARVHASAVALVLALSCGTSSSLAYLCSMDGQLHAELCCGHADVGDVPSGAEVARRNCCESQRLEASTPPATHERDKQRNEPSLVALATPPRPTVRANAVPEWGLARDARGPPSGLGPPLFVQNCSYLL